MMDVFAEFERGQTGHEASETERIAV